MFQVGNRDVQNSDPPQGLHGDLWCIFQLLESIPTILESNHLLTNRRQVGRAGGCQKMYLALLCKVKNGDIFKIK